MSLSTLMVRILPTSPYTPILKAMQNFTDQRTASTLDEVWLLEHQAVFTQGQAGKAEHLINQVDIPVVQSDRGGQITYHGAGQLIIYFLIDLKRKQLSVRDLVTNIEKLCIHLLAQYQIKAYAKVDAPGVYVDEKKIASLGLRVRKGCSYHGLALNVNMDLSPFLCINPCGYAGLEMTQTSELSDVNSVKEILSPMIESITMHLGYKSTVLKEAL